MLKTPRKSKRWAQEAYDALDVAWRMLKEKYPELKEVEKIDLIAYAPAIAGINRGITDKEKIQKAYNLALNNFKIDLSNKEENEPIHHSVCFLLAYLDANVAFGFINEEKSDNIMEILTDNYDINREA